jgi:hypothetical protein
MPIYLCIYLVGRELGRVFGIDAAGNGKEGIRLFQEEIMYELK